MRSRGGQRSSMKISTKTILKCATIAVFALSSVATQASAQGPAGAGAATAAGGGSSTHSYNPLKWIGKKEAKPNRDSPAVKAKLDKKPEKKLRAMQVLSEDVTLKQACGNFLQPVDCLAALH